MSNGNIADFQSRIARIEQARGLGLGFEAPGTLGRSFYTNRQPRPRRKSRLPVLRPVVLLLILGVVLKAVILHQVGPVAYDARVAALRAGTGVDRIGGWIMQADPLTAAVARQIAAFQRLGI